MKKNIISRACLAAAAAIMSFPAAALQVTGTGWSSLSTFNSLEAGAPLSLGVASIFEATFDEPVAQADAQLLDKEGNVIASVSSSLNEEGKQSAKFNFKADLSPLVTAGTVTDGDQLTVKVTSATPPDGSPTEIAFSRSFAFSERPLPGSFYPDGFDANGNMMEFKPLSQFVVYFEPASKIKEISIAVSQGDAQIGSFTMPAPSLFSNVIQKKKEDMEALANTWNLERGLITFAITGYTYISPVDATEKSFTVPEASRKSVTYMYMGPSGEVLTEAGLESGKLLSWYPAGSTDGVITLTFSKPVTGLDGKPVTAMLEYGDLEAEGEKGARVRLPFTISDDGLTMTVDLRGQLHNVATMVPNANFLDMNGKPTDPPSTISISLTNLYSPDGTAIKSNVSGVTATWRKTYDYVDLSLPTPKIRTLMFFNSAAPDTKTTALNDDSDSVEVTLDAAPVFKSANAKFYYSELQAYSVAYDKLTFSGEKFTCAIPAEVKTAGTPGLWFTLSDLAYATDDGVDHTVTPYEVEARQGPREVDDITSLLLVDKGEEVVLLAKGHTVVTLADKANGYYFMQDGLAGLMLDASSAADLVAGTALTGRVQGTYVGNHIFRINTTGSEFTAAEADAEDLLPTVIEASEVFNHVCRLVKFDATVTDIAYNENIGMYVCDEFVPILDSFLGEDFLYPDTFTSVAGIVLELASMTTPVIVPRSAADIEGTWPEDPDPEDPKDPEEEDPEDPAGVGSVQVDDPDAPLFDLIGRQVKDPAPGIYIRQGHKIILK